MLVQFIPRTEPIPRLLDPHRGGGDPSNEEEEEEEGIGEENPRVLSLLPEEPLHVYAASAPEDVKELCLSSGNNSKAEFIFSRAPQSIGVYDIYIKKKKTRKGNEMTIRRLI